LTAAAKVVETSDNPRRTRIVRETAIVYGGDSCGLFLIYSVEELYCEGNERRTEWLA
jgi:hypothetical protein